MKLNREQIIKALECCTRGRKSKDDYPCDSCPYNECNLVGGTGERQISGTCQGWLMKDALALIRELTEENERLRADKKELVNENAELKNQIQEADFTEEEIDFIDEYTRLLNEGIRDAKANTVRKMQKRLHKRKVSYGNITFRVVHIDDIDQIAKEMLDGIE